MDGSRKQTEDCGESIAPHAPPSPGGAFHTPNRGPRIRITRDDMTKWEWAFYVTVIVFFVWVTWLAR